MLVVGLTPALHLRATNRNVHERMALMHLASALTAVRRYRDRPVRE
jgi:hypothetical protein